MKKIFVFTVMAAVFMLLSASISAAQPSDEATRLFNEGEDFYNAQSYSSALDRFSRAAALGHGRAQLFLGFMHANGLGVPRSEARAIEYWKMAARQGYALAQSNLASRGVTDWGSAPPAAPPPPQLPQTPQPSTAQMPPPTLAPAPQMPSVQTQDDVHRFFSEGVDFYNARNFPSALDRFARAAELGHLVALFQIGVMHERGEGVARNFNHALSLYYRAAELGYAVAQYELGVMYSLGDGVPQDDSRAVYWYSRAADQGFPLALNNLGVMLEAGRGVVRDEATAIEFYKLAAQQGEENARNNLARLGIEN